MSGTCGTVGAAFGGLEKEAILGCLSPDIVGTKEIWKFTPTDKDKIDFAPGLRY